MIFGKVLPNHLRSRFICLAEGDEPAADPAAAGAGAAGAGGGGAAAPADPANPEPPVAAAEPEPKPAQQDWKDKQIARQHRKIKELEAGAQRIADLEAENRRLQQLAEAGGRREPAAADPAADPAARTAPPQSPPPPPAPAVDPNALKAQARLEVEIEALEQKLAAPEYAKDWKVANQNFQQAGGINPAIMQSILATDDPAYVLVKVGTDPDLYQELLDMTPQKAAARLIKLGLEKAAPSAAAATPPRRPSAAPPPVDPVRAGPSAQPQGAVNLYDPALASSDKDDAWYAERMRQKRESKGRPWSVGGRAGA